MKLKLMAAAGLTALLLAACDNAPENDAAQENGEPEATVGEETGSRAQDALRDAAQSAGDAARSLGEAGRAAVESLQESAPEIREGLENAGERVRNATDALINDPDQNAPVDAEGDSAADNNDVPESQETPR
jgi:hypothetical protein